MELLMQVKEIVQVLGGAGTLVALFFVIIFFTRPQILDYFFPRKKEHPGDGGVAMAAMVASNDPAVMKALQEISAAMGKLQGHFNDETTAILAEMQTALQQILDGIHRLEKSIEHIRQKQYEMMKYGVPERKTGLID